MFEAYGRSKSLCPYSQTHVQAYVHTQCLLSAHSYRPLQYKGNNYEHFAVKLQSCWHLKGYFLQSRPLQLVSRGTPAPLWSLELKYKQAKPFYLTHCVYPTISAVCTERRGEKMKKKRDRRRERRGHGGKHDGGLKVQCSLQHRSGEELLPCSLHFLWRVFAICTQMLYWFSSCTSGSNYREKINIKRQKI